MQLDINTAKIGRLPFLDFLKMFAMFMVLWGHCIQHLQTGEVWNEPMHKLIYSFHLPLFMMIAGFFSLSSFKLNFKEILKKKGSQLILPCITWGIILYGVVAVMNVCFGAKLSYSPFFVFFQHFWFLKSLFACYLIAYVGRRICKNMWAWIILTLLFAHISTTHQIPIMYFCFMVGVLLRLNFSEFTDRYKLITITSGVFYVMILIATKAELPLKGINFVDVISSHTITPPILQYVDKIIASVSSGLFFIGVMYWSSKNKKISECLNKSSLTKMGKYTLGIYILQSIILETIMAEYIKVDTWGSLLSNLVFDNYILFPIISFMIMVACAYITKWMEEKTPMSFWLLGKKK